MTEDRFTNTEADAGEWERHRAEPDDNRPTLAEVNLDEWIGARGPADEWEIVLLTAAHAIADSYPYNGNLRHDGSEDPLASAYVEGLHDAWSIVMHLARNGEPS